MNAFFSAHPGKARTEKLWLLYTIVWGSCAALTMVTGFAESWTDAPLMAFGVILGGGAFVLPLVGRATEERELALHKTAAFKLGLSVVGFAFLYNYSQTPFFYDVLHMHYGFRSTINIRNNPVFLYFLTIAYFATYAVLAMGSVRFMRAKLKNAPAVVRVLGVGLAPFAIAFLETALNANPFITSLFCYDDTAFVLSFGTLAYGIAFVCALPVWLAIDEAPGKSMPVGHVIVATCAAVYVDCLALDVLRYHVAPHFTQVVEGANGLRDVGTSCLSATATQRDLFTK